jgi:hypothetical protein
MIHVGERSGKGAGLISDTLQPHAGVRLAAYLFFVIFFAQALWIYPAYQKFQQDELNRLSYTGLAIAETLLSLITPDMPTADIEMLGETLSHHTPLKGARIYTYQGELFAEFGELPQHEAAQLQQPINQGARLEMAWLPQDAFTDYLIIGRLDGTHVQASMANFLSFLLKMVFSVTFVSTLLLMWLLRNPGFRPWVQKVTGIDQIKASRKVR